MQQEEEFVEQLEQQQPISAHQLSSNDSSESLGQQQQDEEVLPQPAESQEKAGPEHEREGSKEELKLDHEEQISETDTFYEAQEMVILQVAPENNLDQGSSLSLKSKPSPNLNRHQIGLNLVAKFG